MKGWKGRYPWEYLPLVLALASFGFVAMAQTQPSTPQDALGPAFRTACWQGDLSKATLLLNEGAPIEGRDNLGRTPLFLASHGDPEIVKLLLTHGANIEAAENDGDTPICHACEFGDLGSAQMLLAAGANINQVNRYGHTPLILAARGGHDALVSLLIAHHVDVNYEGISRPALFFAVRYDHLSTATLLLDAGANPNLPIQTAADPKSHGDTILSWAGANNDFAMIDLLLVHGADLNGKSGDGTTPLMDAMRSAKPETVEYLLNKGANVNLQDNLGETALMFGILYDQLPIWQHLLQNGAKLEQRDKKGRTAFILACHYDYPPAIHFLMDQGADIHAADLMDNTALTYAANRGDWEIEPLLEGKGADGAEIHVLVQEKPLAPLRPVQSWALAVGAVYALTNGVNPETLGYEVPRPPDEIKQRLNKDWGVTDTASFLASLQTLQTTGYRAEYQSAGAEMAALSDEDFEKKMAAVPLMAAKARAVRKSYVRWKEKSGLAWDLCRYANLISQGYAAGYLKEWEAWSLLIFNARQVQSSFNSWREMSDNFLDGREIWASQRDPKFEACSRLLLNPNDPNSPWNKNPWKTDLSAN